MSEQLPFYSHAPDTSRRAAEDAAPLAAMKRTKVMRTIREAGPHGMTNDEIHRATGMPPQSVGPRCLELRTAGLVVDSGEARLTQWGCPAVVWVAIEFAPPAEGGDS